jgi:hypothetical protein
MEFGFNGAQTKIGEGGSVTAEHHSSRLDGTSLGDSCAIVGIGSLERFDDNFRHPVANQLLPLLFCLSVRP